MANNGRTAKFVYEEGVGESYTNAAQVMTSFYDHLLILGCADPIASSTEDERIIRSVFKARMSPLWMKRLAALLTERVEYWERTYGVLPDLPVDAMGEEEEEGESESPA
jgi:hypothetical protein